MNKILTFLLLVTAGTITAQNAEYLFRKNYSRLGLDIDYRYMFVTNIGNDNTYYWDPMHSGGFGLQYNFNQNGDVNLRISGHYIVGEIQEKIQTTGTVTKKSGIMNQSRMITLPFEMEYYLRLNSKFYASFSTGPEVIFNTMRRYDFTGYSDYEVQYDGNTIGYYTGIYPKDRLPILLYYGFNFGFSIGYALKPMLIKFNVKYNYQFDEYLYQGITRIDRDGLRNASKHQVTGDYLGLGITIIPRKKLSK
ncbi:MAG: hypothetical protein ACNA7V_15005 [Bacteroidales bacterium]